MSNATVRRDIRARLETRDHHAQISAEQAALRGDFGPERQLIALSARYLELRAAGELLKAQAIKYQAIVIRAANVPAEA